jgi:hypothetical protein
MTTKKEKKAIKDRVSRAYYATCSGIQINVMDISRVFEVGEAAVAAGLDDEMLGKAIHAFVETIRVN